MRVTKSGRLYFQLAVKTLHTEGTEFGLLPGILSASNNPAAHGKTNGEWQTKINKLLCTPKGSPSGPDFASMNRVGSGGNDLATQIAMLRTPRASDAEHGGPNQRDSKGKYNGHNPQLEGDLESDQDGKPTGMRLQPAFVEWMLGYPIGWTDSDHLEIL